MNKTNARLALLLAGLMIQAVKALAQPAIPAALEPWRDWVLFGQEFRACPVLNGQNAGQESSHICAWPGELEVDVIEDGAGFEQSWTLYREEWVPLPGDNRYWPGTVTVDGEPQAAVLRGNRPTVRVPAGDHTISGSLGWEIRPASIPVPLETGLIALTLDGAEVTIPELERGVLWLGLRPELVVEEDRLNVEVYRVLSDTIPSKLVTRIQLDVAGQSREVELTGAMLPDFVGESLNAGLPAELEADGTLRMQIRPGRWEATLVAHYPGIVAGLTRQPVVEPWPAEEVWSYESIPALRVAVLDGAPAVDSQRAGVPAQWRQLPSFAVGADTMLNLIERSRNDASDDNELSLARYLWLDFDGSGFTAEDTVRGELNSGWRLDMAPPYTMTMASLGSDNLLVTEGEETGTQGVELRNANLNLTATSRIPSLMSLPVTGYTESFNSAQTVLFLPPAHRLVAAPGADVAAGAWIERWRLLDIFLALIIAVASWRLLGAIGGVVALATIVLIYHEPAAPHYAWLNLLLITALVRVVPAGRIRAWCNRYRWLSIAALVVLLVPFVAGQLSVVLFPQLERRQLTRNLDDDPASLFNLGMSIANLRGLNAQFGTSTLAMQRSPAEVASEVPVVTGTRARRDDYAASNATTVITAEDMRNLGVVSVADAVNQPPSNEGLGFGGRGGGRGGAVDPNQIPTALVSRIETVTGGASATYGADAMAGVSNVIQPRSRYQPGALVQTGPGLPDWGWERYSLAFSGPIDREQTFSLLIIGPWLVGLWRVASVALALAFGWLLVTSARRGPGARTRTGSGSAATTAAAVAAVALAAIASPSTGHAQSNNAFPPLQLLDELRTRLTEAAPCHPSCAELTDARVEVGAATLELTLEVALQDTVAVPIPGSIGGFSPDTITVDGASRRMLLRDRNGQAWLRLDAGVRSIGLSGPIPAGDSLSVPFPLTPRRIAVDAPGWDIAGVTDRRLPSGTLELIRQRQTDDGDDDTIQATAFPPYVQVTRNLEFGIDWMLTTTVRRVAPLEGAFTIGVDLLPDESVVTEDIDVEDGTATVAFAAGQNQVYWQSRLPTTDTDTLSLTAPDDVPWTETWNFGVGYEWHAEFAGLPVTNAGNVFAGLNTIAFLPRPGETLDVDLFRPEAATGDTIAIDNLNYTRTVGDRSSTAAMNFSYRSTRATEHPIELPAGSELQSVTIDGVSVPLDLDGSTLTLPVTPGEHRIQIGWRSLAGIAPNSGLPVVDLGAGMSNVTLGLGLPGDRWILMAYGPTLGPAVLYWAELAVFVLVAIILGKISLSPLRSHEWLLLGLGLSTFSWPVLVLFGVWAFLTAVRARSAIGGRPLWFNIGQIALGLLTLIMLIALVGSIGNGLLGEPNMHIVTPVSGGQLSWFMDRTDGTTPSAAVISVSLWFYKAAMLAWALWLSFAVIRWLRWAWTAFNYRGLWRGKVVVAGHSEA